MKFLVLIVLLSLAEFVGDANFKLYAKQNKIKNLVIGVVGYVFLVTFLIRALKSSNLLYVNMYWNGIESAIESLLCFVILHERLTNTYQWVGMVIIILGIFLLNVGKKPEN
jgi:multidrug transporter EmrE-like cation transporter